MPGSSGTTVRGALRLTCPLYQVGTRVHRIWGALAGAGILAAVALVAFSPARWITRPLRTLGATTTQLAEGRLAPPPDATAGTPELRCLATAFTRTATRLQHLLKAQQAFASEASHQLKPPLTALRLRLENFEPHLDPRAHGSLEEAVGEVERLGRMVQGLLALARLENTATMPEPVDLDTVLAERAAMREPLAAGQYVALDITGPPVGPPAGHAWAIPSALEESVDNLLRFWRSSESHHDGTGLGLPIVRHLVDASGGTISLHPAPGTGLDARIRLRPVTGHRGDAH
ncbi:sensor histidine kinase [Streptomyces sp. NPDC102394]|uniref:sensor histidine kinase n=1 Tax=Streptomyces sp. NPDC102394 TaxID=3366167 RepID=UPI0038031829